MSNYRVVEKNNPLAVHCLTWSYERGLHWIDTVNLNFMMDKTLTRESFMIQKKINGEWVDADSIDYASRSSWGINNDCI